MVGGGGGMAVQTACYSPARMLLLGSSLAFEEVRLELLAELGSLPSDSGPKRPGELGPLASDGGVKRPSQPSGRRREVGTLPLVKSTLKSPVENYVRTPPALSPWGVYAGLEKPAYTWTLQEVCRWLKRNCPHHYPSLLELFSQHDITGRALLRLNEGKLARMGVHRESQRQELLQQLLQLRLREEAQQLSLLSRGWGESL
ncbi:uncharacterized protein LOC144940675 isoform X2 [Lampetra fluviatilis]